MANAICILLGLGMLLLAHYLGFRQRQSEGRGRLNNFLVRWGIGGSYLEELKAGCLSVVFKGIGGICALIGLMLILKGCGALEEHDVPSAGGEEFRMGTDTRE